MSIHPVRTLAVFTCGALVAAAALAQSGASAAPWADLATRRHEGPRLMMYMQLPIGDARAARPSFGLRLDSAPLRLASSLERMPLLDFQMQPKRSTLMLAGLPVLRMKDSSGAGSDSNMDSFLDPMNPWFWVGGAGAVAAILCVTHNLICKHDDNGGGYTAPTTGGTPPTTGG